MNRSVCVMCHRKLIQAKMIKHGQHWTCLNCAAGLEPDLAGAPQSGGRPGGAIEVLNLYAGIGGNRFLWPDSLRVTAVEYNPQVAAEYKRNFPNDTVIVADAHRYLLKNFSRFHIIWSSPPCQSHSRMNFVLDNKRFPDLSLYEEIIFLSGFYKGVYVVENVKPYYKPLLPAQFDLARHLFWTNCPLLNDVVLPGYPEGLEGEGMRAMDVKALCQWLGMPKTSKRIYAGSKRIEQVYRNCVHPALGRSVIDDLLRSMTGAACIYQK